MIKVNDLYTASNFILQEFVPESIYKYFGDHSRRFINDKLIIIAQELRNDLNRELKPKYKRNIPLYINTWHKGGEFQNRGYRLPFEKYAKFSLHKFGQAIDVASNLPNHEIYNLIMDYNEKYYSLGVRRLEDPKKTKGNGFGWTHIDLGLPSVNYKGIITF